MPAAPSPAPITIGVVVLPAAGRTSANDVVHVDVSGDASGSNGVPVGDASGNGNSGAYAGEPLTNRSLSPGVVPAAGVKVKYSMPRRPHSIDGVAAGAMLMPKSPSGMSMNVAGVSVRNRC